MTNPFEIIDGRLAALEELVYSIKHETIPNLLGENKGNSEQQDITDINGVIELTGWAKPTIYAKANKGELPYMKRGNRLYFSKKEILAYIKEGRVKTNKEIEAEAEGLILSLKK